MGTFKIELKPSEYVGVDWVANGPAPAYTFTIVNGPNTQEVDQPLEGSGGNFGFGSPGKNVPGKIVALSVTDLMITDLKQTF